MKSRIESLLVGAVILCGLGALTASASPLSLVLPQSTAFAILGHSCGGIQEKAYVTGFAPTTGYPTGDVSLQTRCSTGGIGGGTVTYTAWAEVTWDFAGYVLSSMALATAPPVDPAFSATDAYGDVIYNLNNAAYLVVPPPTAPTNVQASQVGDQFQISWTPNGANPVAISSSTLTATPVGFTVKAPVFTATVTGSAATGFLGPLQPQTTYEITVVSTTIGGSSKASSPVLVSLVPASIAPVGADRRHGSLGSTRRLDRHPHRHLECGRPRRQPDRPIRDHDPRQRWRRHIHPDRVRHDADRELYGRLHPRLEGHRAGAQRCRLGPQLDQLHAGRPLGARHSTFLSLER